VSSVRTADNGRTRRPTASYVTAAASSAMYQHLRQTGGLLLRKSLGVDRLGVEAESERLWNEFADVSIAQPST
jgi:hypothetical protein